MGVLETGGPARMNAAGGGGAGVTVLVDAADDVSVTRTLFEAHQPRGAVVVVHPTPGTVSASALGADILAATGRSISRLIAQGLGGPAPLWRAIAAWLIADAVEHVVILRAHRLSTAQHQRLQQLQETAGLHLVLIWHTRDVDVEQVLARPARITADLGEVVSMIPPQSRPTIAQTLGLRRCR